MKYHYSARAGYPLIRLQAFGADRYPLLSLKRLSEPEFIELLNFKNSGDSLILKIPVQTLMQTNHTRYLPFVVSQPPDHNKFIRFGWRFAFCVVDKPVEADFYCAKSRYWVNLYASRHEHPRHLAANILFYRVQEGLFGGHQAAFVVVKLYAVGINSSLLVHIAGVIGVKINAVHMEDGIV
jgi:hypothetical protein